jgi:hypothetical protein
MSDINTYSLPKKTTLDQTIVTISIYTVNNWPKQSQHKITSIIIIMVECVQLMQRIDTIRAI